VLTLNAVECGYLTVLILVTVLTLSAVECGFKARSGQTKDCIIGVCYFSAKYAALRSRSKDDLESG
jgi:hypothetical protein